MQLRTIRRTKDLTQMEVAAKAGISQSAYSQIECGKLTPRIEVAKAISRVLGVKWVNFYKDNTARGGKVDNAQSVCDASIQTTSQVEGLGDKVSSVVTVSLGA
ncbi:hypothetical protein FACS1894184_19200 [Clostridia bacterium]|nr:hypothetical protein FACS1894184_19200 [Clostridia bacterium]